MVDREKCRYKLIYLVILTNLDNPVISIISNHGKDGVSSSSLEVGSRKSTNSKASQSSKPCYFLYPFSVSHASTTFGSTSFVCVFPYINIAP